MATFIHNEPTSLTVIQEAELPETFYKAVDLGIEPAIEVITAIPNAIGALCLNQSGQDQLAAHPNIIPRLFSIFTSEKHLKVLREKEHASFIGAAMDELIRHHPALKPMVFDAIQATFQKIEDLGQAFVPAKGEEHLYMLRLTSKDGQKAASPEKMDTAADGDELMLPVEESRATSQLSIHSAVADDAGDVDAEEEGEGESTKPDTSENVIMSFIDIIGRVRILYYFPLLSNGMLSVLYLYSSLTVYSSTLLIVGISLQSTRVLSGSASYTPFRVCHTILLVRMQQHP
jgi:E3 ubiquitin-protein ligase HUWE1